MAQVKDLIVSAASRLLGPVFTSQIFAQNTSDRSSTKFFATDGTIQTVDMSTQLRYVQCTLQEYQNMESHDPATLYLITNLNDADEGRTL